MCSVPPKFFQVCRLCLMLIDDISEHKIYGTTSVPNDSNYECKCKIKLDNSKCCNIAPKCCSCDKNKLNDLIPNILNSSIPRVPSNTTPFQTNFNKLEKDNLNKVIEPDISKDDIYRSIYNTSFDITDEFKESIKSNSCCNKGNRDFPKQFCCDDSSDNIIIQILKCLSLEVSIK